MKHPRVAAWAAVLWAVAVVAALVAGGGSALPWMLPIAAACSVVLPLSWSRTLALALPVAAVATVDPSAGWDRGGLALASVIAAIGAVGLLDVWRDARPEGGAALFDRDGRAGWWVARRRPLAELAGGLIVAGAAWTALVTGSWSAPGWAIAFVPVAARLAIAAATSPLWRLP
jgi:hypothetical protein